MHSYQNINIHSMNNSSHYVKSFFGNGGGRNVQDEAFFVDAENSFVVGGVLIRPSNAVQSRSTAHNYDGLLCLPLPLALA